jgi:hypothetical protein
MENSKRDIRCIQGLTAAREDVMGVTVLRVKLIFLQSF